MPGCEHSIAVQCTACVRLERIAEELQQLRDLIEQVESESMWIRGLDPVKERLAVLASYARERGWPGKVAFFSSVSTNASNSVGPSP